MKNKKQKLVKILNVATNEVTLIPASELAPGMACVQRAETNEIVRMPLHALHENKDTYHHPRFTGWLKEAIEIIQHWLRDVNYQTYEAWEDGFRRDVNAVQEIGTWFHVSDIFNNFVEQNKPSAAVAKEAYRFLVACMISTPGTVFEIFRPTLLSRETAQKLADDYFNPME